MTLIAARLVISIDKVSLVRNEFNNDFSCKFLVPGYSPDVPPQTKRWLFAGMIEQFTGKYSGNALAEENYCG
ncbi:hypothetical protein GCM10009092_22100 [Bowmanella denitrificans]|uniref:Transposase n=1 Tax=Bowmanella denitrificans TaxID=366582 RepID=A0ABN0X8N6_9ALTE